MTKQLTFTLLAAALLAGCGTGTLSATGMDATTAALRGVAPDGGGAGFGKGGRKGPGGPGGPGGERGAKGVGGPLGLFADLDLSDEQKTQIAAIEAKYRPARPEAGAEKPVDAVAALLEAETLDVAALEAALAARTPQAPHAAIDHGAMLSEIRAVLTDAQREAVIAKLAAAPADRPAGAPADRPSPPTVEERVAQLAAKAALTDAQQAAYVAFLTKLEANRPAKPAEGDHAVRHAAMLAFWQTGDASGLTPPAAAERPAFPVAEFVAAAQLLSADQRVQLLAHGGPGMAGRGHGGPGMGGPGMGGPGMGGDFGGPGMRAAR